MAAASWLSSSPSPRPAPRQHTPHRWRFWLLKLGVLLAVFGILSRLWWLQVVKHSQYVSQASGQQLREQVIAAKRGTIYATEKDGHGGVNKVPLAFNREAWLVAADTRLITNPQQTATVLAELLKLPVEEITAKISVPNDPYVPLKKRVTIDVVNQLKAKDLDGIFLQVEADRFYPNNNIGSHVMGFANYGEEGLRGQYGVEQSLNAVLTGQTGSLSAESDASGVWIAIGERDLKPAEDGSDVVLTIDWTLQYKACRALADWVQKHGASGGSLIVMNPKTGAIRAMCGAPDFNPNVYNEVANIKNYTNPATSDQYEPGSIFKPLTMAMALDQAKVSPESTYIDTGEVKLGTYTVRNSDNKAHGLQTMSQILEESLNTGAIYAMRKVGPEIFRTYVQNFGFGKPTGVELPNEAVGDINSLTKSNEIYAATASFGQGISVTPLQILTAFAAVANNGTLVRPYLVQEIIRPNGQVEKHTTKNIRQVITPKTAALVSGMMVNVIENGHGKKAAVPGYYLAGKTGTAQIPLKGERGYERNVTIGSFIGFGPVHNPDFAMLVRVDRPKDVQFAESSAAPLWGEIAKFILQYDAVPTER